MSLFGLIIVCTIVILIALWIGFSMTGTSIKVKQEIETTALAGAIEEKLNNLDSGHEHRVKQLEKKIDDLENNLIFQKREIYEELRKIRDDRV